MTASSTPEYSVLGLSANGWSALAGWAAAVIAIVTLIVQIRRERFSRGVEIMSRLDTEFRSLEFRRIRADAALFFSGEETVVREREVRELLSFFEKLAFLLERKAIEEKVIWHYFASWILPYFHASRSFVGRLQIDDPNVFRDFDQLYDRIYRIEEKQRFFKGAEIFSSPEFQHQFLLREASLPIVESSAIGEA